MGAPFVRALSYGKFPHEPARRAQAGRILLRFRSPTTYLAYTQLPKIAEACGAEIVWRPMLLARVQGHRQPESGADRAQGRLDVGDMDRWRGATASRS